ncbi:Nestin [Pteropus alecto]|uniref:Nestin n=1 Tax=Pteropus alecto TaxID=9402 RepID=L5JW69_PTEAL|nr:Nestin [Pteropus alecto]
MEGCLGEESFQMWELNRRLEAYLARVKALEEHYELLSAELVGLRAQSGDAPWRARADDELAALRALVDQRWREKHAAEVARDNLEEEVESVAGRCQQQRLARERTAEEMARSRRAGAREGRLELQQLQAERGGLQERRAALEQRLEGCWQERLQATEKFQLAVEALEEEKRGLQTQIAQVLEGRQQLAHLKMSLSLEVATYRTLLEAENSRLRTPGGGPKASFGFQDPKLELHFPGTPEGRRLGPLLSVLSPTPLSSPLPDTLETPVPTFLKRQEFLQASTPTLASTPILPAPQAPCPATDGAVRAQEATPSVLQPQGERQQLPQATWGEASEAIPASLLLAPEEPGGKQQEAGRGQCPEDQASSAPPLSPEHPSLEAEGGEPGESGASSRFRGECEGHVGEPAEKETATEVGMVSSSQQDTRQEEGDLNREEIADAWSPENEAPKSLEEDVQASLTSLEKQNRETPRARAEESQGSPRSLDESGEALQGLEKESRELEASLEEKDVEGESTLREGAPGLQPMGTEAPHTRRPLEEEKQGLTRSREDGLETFLYPGEENQVSVRSPAEESFEALTARDKEHPGPPRPLGEDPTTLGPWEKGEPEPLGSLGKDQEVVRPLEKEDGELLRPLEGERGEVARCLETENLEPMRSAGDPQTATSTGAQELSRPPEEMHRETTKPLEAEVQEPGGPGEENREAGVDKGLGAEPDLKEGGGFPGKEPSGGEGGLCLAATAGAWGAGEGHPKPKEQRVPAEGARGEEGTEGPQDPEGQPEHVVASGFRSPRGPSEGTELVLEAEGGEDEVSEDEVSSGLEPAAAEAAAGAGQRLEQEAVGLEDPGRPGERGEEAKGAPGLEGPAEDPEGTAALEPGRSREPPEPPAAGAGAKPGAPWAAEAVFPAETLCQDGSDVPQPGPQGSEEAEEGAEPVLGAPSPAPEVGFEPKPLAEEEWGSGGFPEGLQDEGEESGDESEADELGDTLPDSTALGLYPRPPASPEWDLDVAQREAGEEGCGPTVLAPGDRGAHPEEGKCGLDSEDLGTEASLLPGVPREVTDPLGHVSQLRLEPAAWGQDRESDGFADEEESGEDEDEGAEGRAPGAGQWGPGPSASSLLALSGPQRESPPGPEPVSIPWDTAPLRDAAASPPVTAQETGSQDSTEPSGSEDESDAAPLEREDQVPGPLGTLGGTEDTPGVNGQGPGLQEELEHVNGGLVTWLGQSDGAGQEKVGALEGGRGSPLEEEGTGGALKPPWAGASLHLGPSQFLQFTQQEGDRDSWSSGED